jgi:hypothetical protein
VPFNWEAVVDNEETRRTRTMAEAAEPILPPNDAFLRELLKLEAAIDALGAGIVDEDRQAVQAAIDDGASFLLEAISLFRRLETDEHADPRRIGTAWYAVRTHHRALLDRFQIAMERLASVELHLLVEQHRVSLTLAIDGLGPRAPAPGS